MKILSIPLFFMLLIVSCVTKPVDIIESAEPATIHILDKNEVNSLSINGVNPFIYRKNIVIKDDGRFVVCRLSLAPARNLDVSLISASCIDPEGKLVAEYLNLDAFKEYWDRYAIPLEEVRTHTALIDRNSMHRKNFTYTSKKPLSYILVFKATELILTGSKVVLELQVGKHDIKLEQEIK